MAPSVALGLLLITVPMTAGAQAPAVIDRIVAVVDDRPITLSDVTAATTLGLVAVVPASGGASSPLDALVDRELILAEVRRYEPPEPTPEQIQRRLGEIRAAFATPEALRTAMEISAMTEARLEAWVRDTLRVEAYIAQRFASPTLPTEEELVRYYREHEAAFARAGVLVPFDEARDAVRQRLLGEQRDQLVANWLAGLRRRASVMLLEAPGR